ALALAIYGVAAMVRGDLQHRIAARGPPRPNDPKAGWSRISTQGRWHFTLDFVKNAQRIRQYADIAGEFLTCAEGGHERKHWRAFVDNLDAAVEGLAKARLLFHADTLDVTRSAKHNFPH